SDAMAVQPFRHIRGNNRKSLWKHTVVRPNSGFKKQPRTLTKRIGTRVKMLDRDQLVLGTSEMPGQIHNHGPANVGLKTSLVDCRPIFFEMKLSIGVRTIMHAHPNGADVYDCI